MINYSINDEPRTCKTEWHEVTLGEYLQVLTAESVAEALAILSGLTAAEVQTGVGAAFLLEPAQTLLATEPMGERPDWLMADLGQDNVGKLELCRQYLREHEQQPELAFPFLYAVYAWPEKYNRLLAISGAGFPSPLIAEVKALPVTEVVGALAHILSENDRLIERYKAQLSREPKEEELLAGIENFEKYGIYPTLLNKAGNDPAKVEALMDVPAYAFYASLCIDAERADYEEKYHQIISKKQ